MNILMEIISKVGGFLTFIGTGIVNWFQDTFNSLFGGLSDIISAIFIANSLEVEIPDDVYNILDELTYGIGYILPIKELLPIPIFMISFYSVKLVISVVRTINGHHVIPGITNDN